MGHFGIFLNACTKSGPAGGVGQNFGNLCMYGSPFYGPAKKRGGGHFYTTLKFSSEYLKYWFVFLRKKKNRFFLSLKIDKKSKKINLK